MNKPVIVLNETQYNNSELRKSFESGGCEVVKDEPVKKEERRSTWIAEFSHVYLTSGFATKDHKPLRRHTCLAWGYWCWENFKERPLDILIYLKLKIKKRQYFWR